MKLAACSCKEDGAFVIGRQMNLRSPCAAGSQSRQSTNRGTFLLPSTCVVKLTFKGKGAVFFPHEVNDALVAAGLL